MNKHKKNVPLIISLSIPILMVVLIAGSIYLPVLFLKPPQYDFVYSAGWNYCTDYRYRVENNRILRSEIKKNENINCQPTNEEQLYYYDVQKNTSRELTFEEAQQLEIDANYKSADGFEVVSGDHSFDIFFYNSSSYYRKYLKKGAFSQKLEIERSYYYNFNFLGWVKE